MRRPKGIKTKKSVVQAVQNHRQRQGDGSPCRHAPPCFQQERQAAAAVSARRSMIDKTQVYKITA
jgi:hypothetical protein